MGTSIHQPAVSCDSSACQICQHHSQSTGASLSGSQVSTQSFEAQLRFNARHIDRVESDAFSDGGASDDSRRSGYARSADRRSIHHPRKRQRSLTFEDLARASLRSRLLPTGDSGSCSQLTDLAVPTLETEKRHPSSMLAADEPILDTDASFLQRLSASSITSYKASFVASTPSFSAVASFAPQVDSTSAPASQQCQADIMCGIDFSPDGWFFGSCGVRKQVRVYSLADVLAGGGSTPGPVWSHRMAAKLSCLVWSPHPGAAPCAYVADYDGEVTQMDLSTGHFLSSVDGHRGRRVWAIAQSSCVPNLVASASDDGTVALWSGPGLRTRAATLTPAGGQPVTSVDFCSGNEYALLTSASNGHAYVYDLRKSVEPVSRLSWHSGAVSHARLCGRSIAITSSTDGAIACWDLSASGSSKAPADQSATTAAANNNSSNSSSSSSVNDFKPFSVYRGHVHNHNFVGLSVRADPAAATRGNGACCPDSYLIASGSEDGRAVAYSDRQPGQLASWWLHDYLDCQTGQTPFSGTNQEAALAGKLGCQPWQAAALQHPQPTAKRPRHRAKMCHEIMPYHSSCEFVSAVAWAPPSCTASEAPLLAVACSDGNATILQLQQ